MTRISHITTSASSLGGGISIALKALATAQGEAGLEVSVIGQRDGGAGLQGWAPGMLREVVSRRTPGMRWSSGLAGAMDSSEPDLLHSHGLWSQPSISVPRWAARHHSPYLVSPHGMLDSWALESSRWKKRLAGILYERTHLRRAACLHALCQSEAESIRAYGLKNPIAIIPNGVDLVDAETPQTEKLKSERKILLFLGRLHPKKGLLNALRAWSSLLRSTLHNPRTSDWTFAIAGWDQGGHEAELKLLCKELGLVYADISAAEFVIGSSSLVTDHCSLGTLPSVVFVGPAFGDTKDLLLQLADAFILPSFSEGLPMSVLEAWSYSLPVLMTDHCNIPEGFAADAAIRIGTDVESIAEGLFSLLSAPSSSLQSMGTSGRRFVEQRFTWPPVAAQIKEVYEWVLGGGSRPDCVRG